MASTWKPRAWVWLRAAQSHEERNGIEYTLECGCRLVDINGQRFYVRHGLCEAKHPMYRAFVEQLDLIAE